MLKRDKLMTDKYINIDGELVELTEVARNGDKKLYSYPQDWRIVGVSLNEVKKEFPDYYTSETFENFLCDYLIERNGEIQFYEPDGTPIDENTDLED